MWFSWSLCWVFGLIRNEGQIIILILLFNRTLSIYKIVEIRIRIRPLIIEAPNFQTQKIKNPTTNSILKVYKLVLKISLENFSSQKIK